MHASPSAFPSLLLPHLLPPPLSLYHSTQLLFSRRRLFEFLPLYYTKSVVFFSSFLLAQPYNSVRTNEVIWSSPFACVRLCVFVSYLINSSLFHRRRVTIDWPYRTRLPLALKKKTCSIYTLGAYSSSAYPYSVVYSKFSLYSVLQLTQKQN